MNRMVTFSIGARGGVGQRGLLIGAVCLVMVVIAGIWGFDLVTAGRFGGLLLSLGISMIMVVGYQVFCGSTGIVSFGHPAFMAIGAYTAGLLSTPPSMKAISLPDLPAFLAGAEFPVIPTLLISGAAAALLALVIGPIVLRLAGAAAGIMTFGLLVISNEVLRNAETLTRGNQTFFGVPKVADFGMVYGTTALVVLAAIAFKFSGSGLRARAVREDPLAAETAGINIVLARLTPWVLSAFIMGVAGAVMAFHLSAFSPRSFYVTLAVPMLTMAVLGGLQSVAGAVAGTLIVTVWQEFMRMAESGNLGISLPVGSSQLSLGVLLVLLLYLRSDGLFGSSELSIDKKQ